MKNKCDYSKEVLQQVVQESKSITEILRKLNCKNSRYTLLKKLKEYDIDVSNLLGQAWNRDNFNYDKFEYGKVVSSALALPALIHKRGHRCETCNNMYWMETLIPLEVHHIDGDKLNNIESNLKLMCPNCHALTDSYCGKNSNKNRKYIDDDTFAEALISSKNIRQALLKLGLTAKGGNYTRARELIFRYNIKHLLEQ